VLAAGALVLVRTLGFRTVAARAVAPVMGAGLALAGLIPSMPASAPARPVLAVSALVLGLTVAVAAARFGSRIAVVATLAAACAVVVVDGRHLVDTGTAVARPRLTTSSPDRVEETRAALRALRSDPVIGVGPGNANLSWMSREGSIAFARYAHYEYLQLSAELGLVGLALLLGVFLVAGQLVRRGRQASAPGVNEGVSAALVALAVHGLFDFGWHVPAVPLAGALLLGLVVFPQPKEQP
jgi:O-antigen ligase